MGGVIGHQKQMGLPRSCECEAIGTYRTPAGSIDTPVFADPLRGTSLLTGWVEKFNYNGQVAYVWGVNGRYLDKSTIGVLMSAPESGLANWDNIRSQSDVSVAQIRARCHS